MKRSKNLEIIQNVLFRTSAYFSRMSEHPPALRDHFLSFGMPLILVGAVGRMIRVMSQHLDTEAPLRGDQLAGVFMISLTGFILAVWMGGLLLARLSRAFGGSGDREGTLLLSISAFTPFMLSQPLAALHPMMGPLSFLGMIFTVWLFGKGVGPVLNMPGHKVIGFTLLAFFIFFGITSLTQLILSALFIP